MTTSAVTTHVSIPDWFPRSPRWLPAFLLNVKFYPSNPAGKTLTGRIAYKWQRDCDIGGLGNLPLAVTIWPSDPKGGLGIAVSLGTKPGVLLHPSQDEPDNLDQLALIRNGLRLTGSPATYRDPDIVGGEMMALILTAAFRGLVEEQVPPAPPRQEGAYPVDMPM